MLFKRFRKLKKVYIVGSLLAVAYFVLMIAYLKPGDYQSANVIGVSALVCKNVPDTYVQEVQVSESCDELTWDRLEYVAGYESCEMTDDEYQLEVSYTEDFADPAYVSGWTTENSLVLPGVSDGISYIYRIHARGADSPAIVSQWSDTAACTANTTIGEGLAPRRGGGGGGGAFISALSQKLGITEIHAAAPSCGSVRSIGKTFKDVYNPFNKSKLGLLSEYGIVAGYPDGTFRPNNAITRAEVLKLALNTLCAVPTMDTELKIYSDIMPPDWFYDPVIAATYKGFVKGYPDGTFHPTNAVNGAEFLKIVTNVIFSEDQKAAMDSIYLSSQSSDGDADEPWYSKYMHFAKKENILGGFSQFFFDPTAKITRMEAVDMIFNAIEASKKDNPEDSVEADGGGIPRFNDFVSLL